jgi:hypothetical protein
MRFLNYITKLKVLYGSWDFTKFSIFEANLENKTFLKLYDLLITCQSNVNLEGQTKFD